MATADEYAAWIVKNSAKRGTPEFDTVAQAYQLAKGEENTATFQQQNAPVPQQPGVMDQIIGAGETALALGTGAVGGTLGAIAGAGAGLAQQILSGEFGTPQAVRAVEQSAAKGAQALTYAPRTQEGQEQTQAAGQFLSQALPPVLPVIAAPGAVMQAARTAAPTVGAAGQISGAAAQRGARATGQAIARPMQAATTAVRETLGMETPAAAPVAVRPTAPPAPTTVAIPVGTSKTATIFDDWVQKSRTQDPATNDVFSAINRRAQAAPDVDFELRMVKTSDVFPTQVGDDYLNSSSMYTAKKIAGAKSIQDINRVEDVLPIRLDENMRIIDGNHRHAAAVLNKDQFIQALVPIGKGTGKVVNIDAVKQGAPVGIPAPAAPAAGARVSGGAAATPQALQRVTTAESLPVPVTLTKGAATRDSQQLEFENKEIKSALGGPLRQRAEENNLQALQNFDALVEMTDAQLMDLSSTGGAVVKSLTEGLTAAKNRTRAAYKAAEKAGELENNVTLNSVVGYINENIPEADLAPILKAAQQKAIAIGAAVPDADGRLVAQPITLKQAESLRQTFQRAGFEGADQFHGGSLKRAFDVETEGMGGDLYKKARQTRLEQARKFENRAIVARLIKNRKGMEDPQVAADQVFRRSVLNSSPEEITFLKRVLLTSGKDGQQAFKELQGATVRHLRDEATKGLGMDSMDRPMISPAKLHQAVRTLDANGRLDVLLGKKNAQIVRDLDDVVRYVTTVPPGTLINTSGTTGTLLAAMAEAGATGALTGLPLPIATGLRQIIKMRQEGKTKAKINDALNALPPAQP